MKAEGGFYEETKGPPGRGRVQGREWLKNKGEHMKLL